METESGNVISFEDYKNKKPIIAKKKDEGVKADITKDVITPSYDDDLPIFNEFFITNYYLLPEKVNMKDIMEVTVMPHKPDEPASSFNMFFGNEAAEEMSSILRMIYSYYLYYGRQHPPKEFEVIEKLLYVMIEKMNGEQNVHTNILEELGHLLDKYNIQFTPFK